jgi:L-2-hydroxycarboxylate dehydrogenase (NAD+)
VTNTVRIAADELEATAARALERAGAAPSEARIQSIQLCEAELRGHASHGLRRLPVLTERLSKGLITSGIPAVHEWTGSSVLIVDGRGGLGPVVGFGAVDAITQRARSTGVAVAAVRNSHHLGIIATYVERMTEAGCAGLVSTTSEALVHAWGGARPVVGTNPLGLGVPLPGGPLILDMSTGATSAGRVIDYAARGESLPLGWAVDTDGKPTTDAVAASKGAISPFGGAKGYALGVSLGILTATLTATSYGRHVHGTLDAEFPTSKGDLFIAFDLKSFGPADSAPAEEYRTEVRESRVGENTVDLPGERARRNRAQGLSEGVDMDSTVWRTATLLAGRPQ